MTYEVLIASRDERVNQVTKGLIEKYKAVRNYVIVDREELQGETARWDFSETKPGR